MNTSNPAWQFIILLLLSIISAASCQQPKLPAENVTENISAESGFEIPQGTAPQRAETYDDIILCGRFDAYRANCPYGGGPKTGPNWEPGPDYIREAKVTLSGCEFAPSVTYRDHIETKAGEVRYNIFFVALQGSSLRGESAQRFYQTGKLTVNYELKLLGTCPGIQVKKLERLPLM